MYCPWFTVAPVYTSSSHLLVVRGFVPYYLNNTSGGQTNLRNTEGLSLLVFTKCVKQGAKALLSQLKGYTPDPTRQVAENIQIAMKQKAQAGNTRDTTAGPYTDDYQGHTVTVRLPSLALLSTDTSPTGTHDIFPGSLCHRLSFWNMTLGCICPFPLKTCQPIFIMLIELC